MRSPPSKFDLVGETLEAALGQDGDSEEEDAIVNQVLDEIGISLNEKVRSFILSNVSRRTSFVFQMANAPRVPVSGSRVAGAQRQTDNEDAEIERMLANLKQ